MAFGLVFAVLIALGMSGESSASWCVCKSNSGDTALQKTLDYACGAGADCTAIHSGGGCFNPNTVLAHCNYAVNSYYQRKGATGGSCDFAGAATLTGSDPSTSTCSYPASASSATNTGTVPVTATPSTTTTTTNPYTTTPNNGILNGMGPSGTSMDDSAALRLNYIGRWFFSGTVVMLLWG